MIRKLFLALFLLFVPLFVHAQTAISASDVSDSFERPIASANLCFLPVDATDTATGFRVGSTQVVSTPVCGLVSNGVLQSGLAVVPTPSGIYYHITAQSRTSNAILRDYGMTPITGSSWTLDTYDPSTAVLPVLALTMGTVTTLPPGDGASCVLSGTSPVLLNCSIPQGATGATGATGAAGGGADAPLTAQYVTHPWDDFDIVGSGSSVKVNGRTSPSGFVWTCGGDGGTSAFISDGGYISPANTYCALTDSTTPVTEAEGVFSWQPSSGTSGGTGMALIFSSSGGVATGALLHLTFSPTGASLEKCLSGGAGGDCSSMASDAVEISTPSLTNWTGNDSIWLNGPLATDGTRYKMRAIIDNTACTYTLDSSLVDGTIWQWTDPDICTIGPSMNSIIWQTGTTSGEEAGAWNEAAIGPSKSRNVTGPSNQTARLVNQLLSQKQFINPTPLSSSGAAWYPLITSVPVGGGDAIIGTAHFTVSDGGYLQVIDVTLSCTSTTQCSQLTGTYYGSSDFVSQIRPTWDGSSTARLDIYLSNAGPVQITGTWSGAGTINQTPTAGATVLGGGSTPLTLTAVESSGAFAGSVGAGYQDATEIAAPSDPSSGNDRLYLNSTTHQLACVTSSGGSCMPTASLPNTEGCLDGFDHLPCLVAKVPYTSYSGSSGPYGAWYTTPNDSTKHQYEVCGFAEVLIAAGGGTVNLSSQQTQNGASDSYSIGTSSGGLSLTTVGNATDFDTFVGAQGGGVDCMSLWVDPNTVMYWIINYYSVTGATPTIGYSWTLTLQQ